MDFKDIALAETETKGSYTLFAEAGGEPAQLTFSKAGTSMIIIDHTEVPEALRGKGAGLLLVQHAVVEAREQGLKILPLCPFAAAKFREHPEWADVLR